MIEVSEISQEIDGSRRITFICREGSSLIGIADIAWSPEEEPALCNLFVVSNHRNKGGGNMLLRTAKNWAISRNKPLWLRINCDDWRAKWYMRHGFTPAEQGWMRFNYES